MGQAVQEWTLDVGGSIHTVTTRETSWTKREIVWRRDGALVAEKESSEEKVVLTPHGRAGEGAGAMRLIFSGLGAPRRAVWFEGENAAGAAHLGVGGVDLEPVTGSPLALRDERMARRPRLYAARHVAAGVAKVVLPIIGVWLLAQLAGLLPDVSLNVPSIPWPDWDLPSIPWPDITLPSIPWLDWDLPGWVRWILDHAKYVVPILIGIGLARSEIRRRAAQPAKREELRGRGADERREPDRG